MQPFLDIICLSRGCRAARKQIDVVLKGQEALMALSVSTYQENKKEMYC